ncbi:MAG: peptide ABC transporter permease, partial [Burkholderia sp.]|nr:peptide ABC transporter permease [Burkholderia sp.]
MTPTSPTVGLPLQADTPPRSRMPLSLAMYRFLHNRAAVLSLALLALVALACFVGPWLSPNDP